MTTAQRKKYLKEYRLKHKKERAEYIAKNSDAIKRQRAEYRRKHREERAKYKREFSYKRYGNAHFLVFRALKKGDIVQQPCEICGEKETQAHHDDYNKPFEVRWLCKKHHAEWHANNTPVVKNCA